MQKRQLMIFNLRRMELRLEIAEITNAIRIVTRQMLRSMLRQNVSDKTSVPFFLIRHSVIHVLAQSNGSLFKPRAPTDHWEIGHRDPQVSQFFLRQFLPRNQKQ